MDGGKGRERGREKRRERGREGEGEGGGGRGREREGEKERERNVFQLMSLNKIARLSSFLPIIIYLSVSINSAIQYHSMY